MRRLFTLALGIGLGAALALLLARWIGRARARLPEAVVEGARSSLAGLKDLISEALREGRRAMREREAELRSGVSAGEG